MLESTGKIAFGNMNEVVNIDDSPSVNTGMTSTDFAGGLRTQPSNMWCLTAATSSRLIPFS